VCKQIRSEGLYSCYRFILYKFCYKQIYSDSDSVFLEFLLRMRQNARKSDIHSSERGNYKYYRGLPKASK